jgi:CRP-like cAMP-binding protein
MIRHFETLARIPLFRSLDQDAVRRLDGQCIWRRVKAAEWVIDHQDESRDLFIVAHGHVRVMIRSISGRDTILRDIRDGEYFGELAAIDGQPRSAGIVAVTDSVVARMSPALFRETIHARPDVCDQLLALLASQIRGLANRVSEYNVLDVRHRIYAELLRLARPAQGNEGQAILSPPPTHAEIAARVSTHREAVSRELKSLERSQLLERRRGALILLNPGHLADLIERARS